VNRPLIPIMLLLASHVPVGATQVKGKPSASNSVSSKPSYASQFNHSLELLFYGAIHAGEIFPDSKGQVFGFQNDPFPAVVAGQIYGSRSSTLEQRFEPNITYIIGAVAHEQQAKVEVAIEGADPSELSRKGSDEMVFYRFRPKKEKNCTVRVSNLGPSRIVVGAGIFSSETQMSVAASNAHDDLPSAMAHFAANLIGKGYAPLNTINGSASGWSAYIGLGHLRGIRPGGFDDIELLGASSSVQPGDLIGCIPTPTTEGLAYKLHAAKTGTRPIYSDDAPQGDREATGVTAHDNLGIFSIIEEGDSPLISASSDEPLVLAVCFFRKVSQSSIPKGGE